MKLATDSHIAPSITQTGDGVELSVVMPCLNEKATVGACVKKARDAMERHGIRGEVIVADNGSTDGSREITTESSRSIWKIRAGITPKHHSQKLDTQVGTTLHGSMNALKMTRFKCYPKDSQ